MKTMTIRNIPDEVIKGVKEMSETHHISMNAAVITLLSSGLGTGRPMKRNDFSAFCGGWTEEEHAAFERATARSVNPEDWK